MDTAARNVMFSSLVIAAYMCAAGFAARSYAGVAREFPELMPRASNDIAVNLSLANMKRRNIVRPGRPVSLRVTFRNTGPRRLQVQYSRVYRAGNLVFVGPEGQRIYPEILTYYKYHLLEDDWHLIPPGREMQVFLEGAVDHGKDGNAIERKISFDEMEFTLPHPGEYTLFFVLRQDEPSRVPFVLQDEWTGCAVSNAVKIRVR